jgi:hypothetical protein
MKNDNKRWRGMELKENTRKVDKDLYVLTMTEEEANTAFLAFELLARVTMGQIENIADYARFRDLSSTPAFREELGELRRLHLNEQGITSCPDYGKQAWDLYQALRYAWYWNKYPDGGMPVWFDEPMRVSDHMPDAMVERNEAP